MSSPYSQTFTVSTSPSPRALQRIIAAAAQRQCEIVSLTWRRDELGGTHLTMEVLGAEWHVRRLGAWLAALVDVTEVSEPFTHPRSQAWAAGIEFRGWRTSLPASGE